MARRYGMIEPFSERVDGQRVVSYGLQPAGYDARLHPGIEILDWAIAAGQPLDPLGPQNDKLYFPKSADPFFDVPPHGFVVARTVEHFRIPRNCVVRGAAKTTYSAVGLNLDVASIHPGWEGRLRLHLSNATPVGIRIYGNMGLIYLEFHEIDGTVERAYGDLQNPRFQEGRS
jgi:dCTP deaminase